MNPHEDIFAAYMVRPKFLPRTEQQTTVTLCGATLDVAFDFEPGDERGEPGTYSVDAVKLGGKWFATDLLPEDFLEALTIQLEIEFAEEAEQQAIADAQNGVTR